MKNICQDVLDIKASQTLQGSCKVTLDMSEPFSQLIKQRLEDLGISKAELAKRAGVSRTYIGDLANGTAKTQSGTYRPKPEVLSKLANALEVSEIEILQALGYSNDEPKVSDKVSPSQLAITGFEGLDEEDLEDIAEYVAFKRAKRAKINAQKK